MSRFLFILLLGVCTLYAAVGEKKSQWTHQHRYKLKKDEIAQVLVSTAESKGEKSTSFFFRWTLVVGNRVTTLINHRGYPHQVVLYKKRSLDKVRFDLLNDGTNRITDETYLLLVLSDINQSQDEVDFDIFIKDNKKRILVDFNPQEKDKAE